MGLCVDPADGALLVTDSIKKCVFRLGTDNKVVKMACDNHPFGVAVDNTGAVYVLERTDQKCTMAGVTKFAKDGSGKTELFKATADLTQAKSLAIDPNNTDLYVLTRTSLYKLDTKGKTNALVKIPEDVTKNNVELFSMSIDSEGLPAVSTNQKSIFKVIQKSKADSVASITRLIPINDQQVVQGWAPGVVAVDQTTDDIYFADDDKEKGSIRKLTGNRACRMCGTSCVLM